MKIITFHMKTSTYTVVLKQAMDELNEINILICGNSSNKWSNRFSDMRTNPKSFCLSISFILSTKL